ncbi:MAG TPA: hypothetical protein VGG20_18150 [Thermoanaerobaculia bacterium]
METLPGALNELLTRPLAFLERTRNGGAASPVRLLAASALCYALYGAAAGFFQGGDQILVAALKAPLIIFFILLLCLPSLYVFSAVAGAEWTRRSFLVVLSGFAATLALVLLALLPINWLFSTSSRYLGAAAFFQFVLWILALGLAWRFLGQGLRMNGARGGLVVWLLLFCVVSLQAATVLRPVLSRKAGAPIFVSGKKSFLEQIGDVFDEKEEAKTPATKLTR